MIVENLDILGLFLTLSGLIIGLGSVTVIDIHGFLGRRSHYWTETTIRTHKVTKPLIWLGIVLFVIGNLLFFRQEDFSNTPLLFLFLTSILVANGLFLSFWLSPRLLEREKEGRADELLPTSWQIATSFSFLVSFFGWWSMVFLLTLYLLGVR